MMATALPARKMWTEEELQALPDDGHDFELVNGELVMSPKNNFQHEEICADLMTTMRAFAKAKRLGVVLGSNAGCWMRSRNCRAPDICFLTKARLKEIGFTRGTRKFLPVAPDLAVEILSPSNTRAEIDARLQDFFASGAQLVWIIDPENQSAEVCHSLTRRRLIGRRGSLDGEKLLPGFRFPIADLFREWDWQ